MEERQKHKRKIAYKWVIASLGFLMVFTRLGFCSSPKSLFVSAIITCAAVLTIAVVAMQFLIRSAGEKRAVLENIKA